MPILLLSATASASGPPEVLELRQGVVAERRLAPGETHVFRLELEAGRFLHLVASQLGVDVELALVGPDGRRLVASDRPIAYRGPEELLAVADRPGAYRLEVAAPGYKRSPGKYEIRVEALRPAAEDDRLRSEAARLLSHGNDLRVKRDAPGAIASLRQALALWREAGDPWRQGEVWLRLGHTYHFLLGDRRQAATAYRQAVELFRAAGDDRWQALALRDLGLALFGVGETEQAIALYHRALPLSQAAGDRHGEAATRNYLGQAYRSIGEPQKALDAYRRVLELCDPDKDLTIQARVLQNLGVVYLQLGKWEPARDHLEAAERAFSELGDPRGQAGALNQLGQLQQDREELDLALATYRRVLELRRQAGDARGEAVTLGKIGRVHQALAETVPAAEHYRAALSILRDADRPRDRARVLLYQGSLLAQLGRERQALDALEPALDAFRRLEERDGEAETLLNIARVERSGGDLEAARARAEAALSIVEAVRPRPVRQDHRISFFATVQHHYDFYVDLLMELRRTAPAGGHDAAALEASERARARALLDLLTEAGFERPRGIDPELLGRQGRIRARLNDTSRERMRLLERGGATPAAASARVAELEGEERRLIEELEAVRGEILRRSPGYAAWTQPRPLSLAEIRRQVLEEDVLLLEYKLGVERSFLWAVTADTLASFDLPGREDLEELVRTAHRHLPLSRRPGDRIRAGRALCALSRELLQPLGERLWGKRLLVVPDGALSYLPFAALPDPRSAGPCSSAPTLVSEHEITYLPSASVLAVLRREHGGRRSPPGLLAVVADPVFDAADERLSPSPSAAVGSPPPDAGDPGADLARSAAESGLISFGRLVHSGREAEALLSLVPVERSFRALGFEATKETVLGGRLSGYRLVHFATHGLLNSRHPDLSGLVLSQVDEEGAPIDGFLRAHEIYDLDLSADLVALSACRTALGQQVRGEGLVGLTRAFLYAGAARVMVSLWSVGDRSTAELMRRFYRYLIEERLRPAAALRQAQLSMLREGDWASPYHWAGFVIQGEPR